MGQHSPSAEDEHPDGAWDMALRAVLAASVFRQAGRQGHLLTYLVRGVAGAAQAVPKEAAIAIDVFGRDPAVYDPRKDAIVRVEMGRLRKRLAQAQAELPAAVSHHIDIPLGAYAPVLSLRSVADASAAAPRPVHEVAQAHRPQRLALLPVTHADGIGDAEAGALRHALLLRLGAVSSLRVVSSLQNPHVAMTGAPAAMLAHRLSSDLLLSVHLLAVAGRWRARLRLVRGRDDLQIVAREVEGPSLGDLHWTEPLSANLVAGLLPWLSLRLAWGDSAGRAARPATADLLRRARLLQRQATPQSEARAVALVDDAIRQQPDHAPSHLLMATLCGNQGNRDMAASPALYARALGHALRAVQLDPADVDAVAMAHWYRYMNEIDGRTALTTVQALAADHPYSQRALHVVAAMCAHAGRTDEALAAYRRLAEIAPMEVNPLFAAALALLLGCRHAQGLDLLEQVLEVEPHHVYALRWRIAALAGLGRHGEAGERFDELAVRGIVEPIDLQCMAAHLAAWRGDLDTCRALYDQPALRSHCDAVPPLAALRAAHLGQADEAAARVLAMEAARDGRLAYVMWGLHGRALRRDPRIEAVCQRLGWRALPA